MGFGQVAAVAMALDAFRVDEQPQAALAGPVRLRCLLGHALQTLDTILKALGR
jgi:hypothetical protein